MNNTAKVIAEANKLKKKASKNTRRIRIPVDKCSASF